MVTFNSQSTILTTSKTSLHQQALLQGEVLLDTRPHTAWGAAFTAHIYLPLARSIVWQKLTDYPRWVQYFPVITHSEVLSHGIAEDQQGRLTHKGKRLYQVGCKAFLFFSAQVEIYLNVLEVLQQQVQFRLERGSFQDFAADLALQDYANGTLVTYAAQATPAIPVPSIFMQQVLSLDIPNHMREMRRVLCGS